MPRRYDYTNENPRNAKGKIMDVIIFSGQSNMQGSTGEKDLNPPVKNAFEYKYLTDTLVPLCNPVGEDIGDKVLCASALGNGSLVPAFCRAYAANGRQVVAIHAAKGDTSISEWQKGTARFDTAVKKIKAGLLKVGDKSVNRIFVVWLQGESDAIKRTSAEDYLKMLVKFKNDLKSEIPIDKFAIIRQGYFAEYAPWVKGSEEEKKYADEQIMKALDEAPACDGDFLTLTRICSELSVDEKYLNPNECGPHYNNAAMEIIGSIAGQALLNFAE